MSQSLIKNYVHITFSTKFRKPFIDDSIKEDLFSYIGGICKTLKCNPIIVGGYKDHVHILCLIAGDMSVTKLVEKIKSHSSKWIKTKGPIYKNFYWQNGYGCFSVNLLELESVERYIRNQEVHHRSQAYKDEYEAILRKFDIEHDPRFLWDS